MPQQHSYPQHAGPMARIGRVVPLCSPRYFATVPVAADADAGEQIKHSANTKQRVLVIMGAWSLEGCEVDSYASILLLVDVPR